MFNTNLKPFGRLAEILSPEHTECLLTPLVGPTRLLILQPTSFCNINCSYCYVPDRDVKGVMAKEILEQVCERLINEKLLSSRCSVVWHAGEPLAAGKSYMEEAFSLVHNKLGEHTKAQLTVQTNATLIDAEWVDLFNRYNVRVGVSLDGPKWIHDLHRKDRTQRGSFDATLRGLQLLQKADVEYYVLAVVTQPALKAAAEFYNFFADLGVKDVGLIPEEVDGSNLKSSLEGAESVLQFKKFVHDLHKIYIESGRQVEIREFRGVRESLFYNKTIDSLDNNKTRPYHILTVAKDGSYTSFSPELSGMSNQRGEDYAFGNILTDPLRASTQTKKFRRFYADFLAGVARCQAECDWFALCGGGLPSNKLAELGRLDVAQTMSCQLHLQVFAKMVLDFYNQKLEISNPQEFNS